MRESSLTLRLLTGSLIEEEHVEVRRILEPHAKLLILDMTVNVHLDGRRAINPAMPIWAGRGGASAATFELLPM